MSVLTHNGIKGQRWGVRRFQNEDGSLTQAGKDRYKKINSTLGGAKKITDASSKLTDSAKNLSDSIGKMSIHSKTKDLSKMSDKDLQDTVRRMNLERQYADLTSNQISRGRANVGAILDGVGATLGIASSAIAIALAVREFKKS